MSISVSSDVENITSKKQAGSIRTASLVGTAMLSAVAFVLMYLEISIPIMPSFIKLDFSDLPELIATFAYGPFYGFLVCLIKNLLHLPFTGSAMIGELSNFILGVSFVVPAGIIYRKMNNKLGALVGGIVGALVMGIVSVFSNYFLVYPLYYSVLSFPEVAILAMYQVILPSVKSILQCLLIFNVPFTIVKGLISVAFSMIIYKPLSPFLKGTFLRK